MDKAHETKQMIISGIFILAGVLSVVAFLLMLGEQNNPFTSKHFFKIEVDNVQNLRVGAAVQYKGIRIGSVSSIEIKTLDSIFITGQVESRYREWIREDSYIAFRTQGVLGDRFLEILGGSEDSVPLNNYGLLQVKSDSTFDIFIDKGEDLLTLASRVLGRIDLLFESIQPDSLTNILTNLENTTGAINQFSSTLEDANLKETFTELRKTSHEIQETSKSARKIMTRIDQGPGSLHSLIYDNSLHRDVQTLLGGAQRNRILNYFIRESLRGGDR